MSCVFSALTGNGFARENSSILKHGASTGLPTEPKKSFPKPKSRFQEYSAVSPKGPETRPTGFEKLTRSVFYSRNLAQFLKLFVAFVNDITGQFPQSVWAKLFHTEAG